MKQTNKLNALYNAKQWQPSVQQYLTVTRRTKACMVGMGAPINTGRDYSKGGGGWGGGGRGEEEGWWGRRGDEGMRGRGGRGLDQQMGKKMGQS